jgi:hypothetical protein
MTCGFNGTQDLPSARNFEALLEICYTAQLKQAGRYSLIFNTSGNLVEGPPRHQAKEQCPTRRSGGYARRLVFDIAKLSFREARPYVFWHPDHSVGVS